MRFITFAGLVGGLIGTLIFTLFTTIPATIPAYIWFTSTFGAGVILSMIIEVIGIIFFPRSE